MLSAMQKIYRDHWAIVLAVVMIASLSLGATLQQVNTSSPQTLTNKTLTAPTITDPNITGTVSGGATYSGITLDSSTFNDVTLTGTVGGSATYTAPTLSSPNWTGTATGTLTGGTFASPTIQGTVSDGTGLTMPTFIAGGNITGSGAWRAATIATDKGGTGLTTVGTANQVLGMDAGGTGLEYKSMLAGSSGITVAHTANTITLTPATDPFLLENFALAASVSNNSLFIHVKGADGNDPSPSNPVRVAMRHTTQSTGTYQVRSITVALTFELSAGSTLGASANETIRFYIYLIDNSGTLELAVSRQALFDESILHTTSEQTDGGDSTTNLYSTTQRTNVPVRLVGVGEITSGPTAGDWNSPPDVLTVWKPGMRKTGDIVQRVFKIDSANASTTNAIPFDGTVPTSGEGVVSMSATIAVTSTLNSVHVQHVGNYGMNTISTMAITLLRNTETSAIAARSHFFGSSTTMNVISLFYVDVGVIGTNTYKVHYGPPGASTAYFNAAGDGVPPFGGKAYSTLELLEVYA